MSQDHSGSDGTQRPTQQHLPGTPPAATGDAQVDEAMSQLQGLEELSAEQQADVIEAVHDQLRSTLAGLDKAGPAHPQPDRPDVDDSRQDADADNTR